MNKGQPLESTPTLGEYPHAWRVPPRLEGYPTLGEYPHAWRVPPRLEDFWAYRSSCSCMRLTRSSSFSDDMLSRMLSTFTGKLNGVSRSG